MLQDGQRLGEFEILAKLGQGGMGAVYKARQTVLRRLVAIKTLQSSLSSDAEFVTRFHNEAVAAAGLNHPNLVQVYAAGQSEGIHWFAMEFVDGESVQARLKRLGKLDPAEALAIGMHVQTALEHGWRKAQLIHRDIKPDNIFLSNDGEVKLGDLGLAKSSDQQQGLTMTGASMGTPLYISPEQAEGKRDIDLRTDIYSLGATLYHLITGTPPYTGESSISVMMKHVGAPVPDLREVDPTLPPALAAVICKMMQKAPADRYGSYEELGSALRQAYAALTDPTPIAPQKTPIDETPAPKQPAGKKRPAWLLPAVVGPLVALGAFALLKSKGPAPGEKAPLEAPQVTANDTQPPVGKVPVENAKAETRTGVDPIQELVRKLEAKLLPVPGTEVLMSKTELTVGEWKLYLRAEGGPELKQPGRGVLQTDEHPVVNINWEPAKEFCEWLSARTGKPWRLPTNAEWDAAVGHTRYPWGDYYPPHWDDGNYAILDDGKRDPSMVGNDGIRGTAPVASFKPNQIGFYDLGGNATEWVWDAVDEKGNHIQRGLGWKFSDEEWCRSSFQIGGGKYPEISDRGFRVVLLKPGTQKPAPTTADTPPAPQAPAPAPALAQMPPTPQPAQPTEDTTPKPPKGFRPLFDGATLNGWRGLNPHDVLKAAPEQKNALVQKQSQEFPNHWRVENGELVNPGTGPYATTVESFGNIDLLLEYKTVPGADSGIYLRGTPQIQIWTRPKKTHETGGPGLGQGASTTMRRVLPGRIHLCTQTSRLASGTFSEFVR